MEKLIGCVGHQDGHIIELRVYEPDTDSWSDMSRAAVAKEILSGLHTYRTYYYEASAKQWRAGPLVRAVAVNGTCYLRTDDNQISEDNLGSLPALAVCPFHLGKVKR